MTLLPPQWVQIPGIQDEKIRYSWDDWDVEAVDMPLDPDFQERLAALSSRAIAAFTIGTAEWIVHRFAGLSADPRPGQYLEAGWAQLIDFRYSEETEINLAEWRGPVRGPLGIAIRRVLYAIQQAATLGGDPAWRAGRAAKLAQHVLPSPHPFVQWQERVLDRMLRLWPTRADDPLGDVIPREALDPDPDFDPTRTESLIRAFLAQLDRRDNPFLLAPDVLIERGFEGRPYAFDAQAERQRRLDW
jgi:hypothetical protein